VSGGHYERGLFRQLQEAIAQLEESEKRHKLEVAQLCQIIEAQAKQIAQLTKEIELLRAENDRLRSMLNNNSNNSSQPPSSDQKGKRINTYNRREKSGRHKGAQPGHPGKTLSRATVEELIAAGKLQRHVVQHGSGHGRPVIKYVLDIEIVPSVTEHRFYPNNAGKYEIPDCHNSDVIYGDVLRALVVHLYGVGVVSNDRIQAFIESMTDGVIKPSAGSVYGMLRGFSQALSDELEVIHNSLLNQDVLYTDNTNVSIDGHQVFIRNLSTAYAVLYTCMPRKNLDNLRQMPVLPVFAGTLVHDHEVAIYQFGTGHGECNVHLLRYLTKNTEDTGHIWSDALRNLLCSANQARKHADSAGVPMSEAEIQKYSEAYDSICAQGEKENEDCRPKWAKQKEEALLRRLRAYKANYLLFLYNAAVAFDNNLSERDLRKCKNRQKMSGGFRTFDGAQMYCRILSFIETCKRRQLQPLSAMMSVLRGQQVLCLANIG